MTIVSPTSPEDVIEQMPGVGASSVTVNVVVDETVPSLFVTYTVYEPAETASSLSNVSGTIIVTSSALQKSSAHASGKSILAVAAFPSVASNVTVPTLAPKFVPEIVTY